MMIYKNKKLLCSLTAMLLLASGCGGGSGSTATTAPQITTVPAHSVQEGTTALFTVQSDQNGLTYSIVGGADKDLFTIDSQKGTLQFKTAQDYENPLDADVDRTYEVTVSVQNATGKKATQTFYITLLNDPSDDGDQVAPRFTSATNFPAPENEIFEATVMATDNESDVTYGINGGPDAKRFRIDPLSGKLTFYHLIPDFEISSDANNDKIYEVTVSATDKNGNKAVQDITVTVEDDVTDSTYGVKRVFKTGLPDGEHGDARVATSNGDNTVSVLERDWEDTAHIDTDIGYYDAHAYCANLELGDKSDWRLPTRREMFEIVNYGNSPKIDGAFEHKNGGYFWTSQELFPYTGVPGDENNQTWTIQFGNGIDYPSDKTETAGYHVRCVRGFTVPNGDFSGQDVISDSTTGIEWENVTVNIDPTLTWNAAKTRCANLTLGGKDDWRLPNINELHSIIPNNNNEYQFADLTDQKTGPYWSVSLYDTNTAYYVENVLGVGDYNNPDPAIDRDFQNDALGNINDGGGIRSRCIRGGN